MDSDGKSFKYKTKIVGNTLERPESTTSTNFTCWSHYSTQIS